MSRVSSRSAPSASATRGSSAIDLGKDSGVDMGSKTQPSVTSGGIGVTQEVGNIGGVSVTGGVSVEVSPLALNISGDPSENTVSIAGSAEVPGGLLGISGGATIDTKTGEIIGGSIGGEIGGLGINLSANNKGDVGIEFTYQIPFTPVEISVGLGFPKKENPSISPSIPAPSNPTKISASELAGCSVWRRLTTTVVENSIQTTQVTNSRSYGVSTTAYWTSIQDKSFIFGNLWLTPTIEESYQIPGRQGWYTKLENSDYPGPVRTFEEWASLNPGLTATRLSFSRGESPLPQILSFNGSDPPADPIIRNQTVRQYSKFVEVASARPIMELYQLLQSIQWSFFREYKHEIKVSCSDGRTPTPSPPVLIISPFPNPPPRRQNVDTCCQENLKFLRAIYVKLGLTRFPGELPATIIQEVPNEGEEPAEPPQVPIPDLVSLLDWQFRRDDERWGQWEVQINVKDADVTKEGDQGKQVKFPNLAESIAEIEGQMLSLTTNIDALIAITTKNLVESGLSRQEAIKGYLASKSIIKYMAFKTQEIDVTVPLCFTPGAESIDALVKESELHLKGLDYTEKETLRDIFLDLLQAAAVIRAVHWQRIDTKKDTKSQLLGLLKGSVDLANSIRNPAKPADGSGEPNPAQNFEDFIDSAEDGFRNTTGITDMQNPYGKTPDRRPRIRQIGDNISQAGKDN